MKIGIDASRAFLKQRTGIEEYSYQVIKHLANKLDGNDVVLYIRSGQLSVMADCPLNFPSNWKIKIIKWPRFWTQIGLSLEMLFHPVDVLFIPAHTVPIIHPENTIVTIHGLEYEIMPQAYSAWAGFYMRFVIKNSCRWAKKIISVSENTKKDLMGLYGVSESRIKVIYEGYEKNNQDTRNNNQKNFKFQISNSKSISNDKILNSKYLLFIGRLEERKNIVGIIEAFEILKRKYAIPHKLVLAGKFGFGAEKIRCAICDMRYAKDIILTGFVSEEEKWELLKNADVFLFPTFYEGFGIPILEAQSVGVPVVAGNNSSIKEISSLSFSPLIRRDVPAGQRGRVGVASAILVDPNNPAQIAEAAYEIISNKNLKDEIIKRGYENIKRFSWEKCAKEIAGVLMEK